MPRVLNSNFVIASHDLLWNALYHLILVKLKLWWFFLLWSLPMMHDFFWQVSVKYYFFQLLPPLFILIFPDLKSFCTFSPVLQVCPVALWNCPFEILHKFFYYHAKGKKCNCSQIKLSWSHICFVEKHALTSLELMPLWCAPAFFIFCSFPLISTTLLTHYCLYWRCTWPSIRS